MMKRISDALPSALIAVGTGSVLGGFAQTSSSIERVLPYPASIFWIIALFVGSLAVIAGVCLRTRKPSRRGIWGQGLELVGLGLVGGMMITYAAALWSQFGFGTSWLSIVFMVALGSVFLGPWAVIVGDLVVASHTPRNRPPALPTTPPPPGAPTDAR